jgi:3-oxoacyl-[acyl-carrier-protein] synthase-3
MRAGIIGIGSCVPERVLKNEYFINELGLKTSNEWIITRTGIEERRILRADEEPAQLGIEAAKKAIEDARIDPQEIDLLITATNFPIRIVPGSSPEILTGLSLTDIPFFDLIAGCTGFVYALADAAGKIELGNYKHILVIGLEALSRVTDYKERETCVLFGDGAGAVVIGSVNKGGILSSYLGGNARLKELLRMEAGGTRLPASYQTIEAGQHFLRMEGQGVFKEAVRMMAESILRVLSRAELSQKDIDWIIPHQANLRITQALAKRLNLPMEKVISNIDKYGNTSTASIPLALDEAVKDGRIQKGDLIVLTGFGAGVTYGANLIRW